MVAPLSWIRFSVVGIEWMIGGLVSDFGGSEWQPRKKKTSKKKGVFMTLVLINSHKACFYIKLNN